MSFAKEAFLWIRRITGIVLAVLGVLGILGALAPYADSDPYAVEPYMGDTLIMLGVSAGIAFLGWGLADGAKDKLREAALLAQWATEEESKS